ncbi:anti-repressor SinI family protein [Priestia aryabhattai]
MEKYEKYSESLPQEWMDLAKQAMESNITKKEFKEFLNKKSKEIKQKD